MPRTRSGHGCRHAPLPAEEKKRRAKAREKLRGTRHLVRTPEQREARRLREGKPAQPGPKTTERGGQVSPTEERLALGRTVKRGAHKDPAATMRSDGLFKGHGVLVSPPGVEPEDFEAWLAWSRDPRGWEAAQEKGRAA